MYYYVQLTTGLVFKTKDKGILTGDGQVHLPGMTTTDHGRSTPRYENVKQFDIQHAKIACSWQEA